MANKYIKKRRQERFDIFNPKDISGLRLWLDASDIFSITFNGTAVSQWNDKSGNNNNATQGTAAFQPTLNNNGINFDGTQTRMVITDSASISITGNISLFAVVNPAGDSTQRNILSKDRNSSYRWRIDADNKLFILIQPSSGNFQFVVSTSTITTSKSQIVGTVVTLGTNVIFYANGLNIGSPAFSTDSIADTTGDMIVGGTVNPVSGVYEEFFNGVISEVLLYNGALSNPNRQVIESYLANKWGITI